MVFLGQEMGGWDGQGFWEWFCGVHVLEGAWKLLGKIGLMDPVGVTVLGGPILAEEKDLSDCAALCL